MDAGSTAGEQLGALQRRPRHPELHHGVGVVAAVIGVIVLIVVAVNSLNGIASSSATPRALTCPAAASQTVGGATVYPCDVNIQFAD